jgi:hypothetical protein
MYEEKQHLWYDFSMELIIAVRKSKVLNYVIIIIAWQPGSRCFSRSLCSFFGSNFSPNSVRLLDLILVLFWVLSFSYLANYLQKKSKLEIRVDVR